MSTDTSRLSFAKVAASTGKDNNSSFARIATSTPRDTRRENTPTQQNPGMIQETKSQPNGSLNNKNNSKEGKMSPNLDCRKDKQQDFVRSGIDDSHAKILDAVKALNVTPSLPKLAVNGSNIKKKTKTASGFPDIFNQVDSDSESVPKYPSLDDKSTVSGINSTIDEKESILPEESVSVKAVEDDEIFSGRGSVIAGSRIGSESAALLYRAQFCEVSERQNNTLLQEDTIKAVVATPNSFSGQQLLGDRKSKTSNLPDISEGFNLFYRQSPDEKLLEALDSVKDRIFLLRLEQEVIEFVRSSKEPFIDLPPCNSFCRMITHKLADYYHLTHQVDAVAGAVRIFRTPFCRLPPSLTSLSNPLNSLNTPPPATMKIMRRGGDTGPSPSKAVSESGSDEKEKGLSAKEKSIPLVLSREEREAAYNKARERIFGKEEKSRDPTPEIEDGNEISRSSSLSTKDRTGQSRRTKPIKQRRDDSENFDSRSQYAPFFPQQQGPTWIPSARYSPIAHQSFIGNNRPFQHPLSPQYTAPPQQFNPVLTHAGNMQSFSLTQVPHSTQKTQRFQSNDAHNSTFGSPVQSPSLLHQQWQQPIPSSPYQQPLPTVRAPPISIPYAFGQLPNTVNPADPKSQHPIPGSFNRHAFNPKTQSFVPGGIGVPMLQQVTHHVAPYLDNSHHNSSPSSFNAFNSAHHQFSNGMSYNMARQNSKNSLPSYHVSPLLAHRQMMHQTVQLNPSQGMLHGMLPGMPQNHTQGISIAHSIQMGNHLPNSGNPSTLPPKPPSGI
ncbi:putative r3h domain-containing protein [Golovinomyces cichoracearum]|uniref:Putative r3h domain-containing protein n=1 Tax=Golovinomyces cichoracearum TaxID=62708 RepID=A0A420J8U5_9PEZI|nr:putative r3h domain-containing protein [Golovinomyces cichoracearum]